MDVIEQSKLNVVQKKLNEKENSLKKDWLDHGKYYEFLQSKQKTPLVNITYAVIGNLWFDYFNPEDVRCAVMHTSLHVSIKINFIKKVLLKMF